jgi:hypothetical protein
MTDTDQQQHGPSAAWAVRQLWEALDAPAVSYSPLVAFEAIFQVLMNRQDELLIRGLSSAIVDEGYHIDRERRTGPPMTDTDQQKARIIYSADERAISDYNHRLDQLRGVSPEGFPEDNERSDLLREGFRYGVAHGRAEAMLTWAASVGEERDRSTT